MIDLATRFADGVEGVIEANELPWHVVRLGARAEYSFLPDPPESGGQSAAGSDHELGEYLHLFCLNRGVLITPFHNMALMSPATTAADVDRHTEAFAEACELLTAG
jgi:glutamate-1-semialdehyde aminotransferase